jgi:hypothetical protein
VAANEIAYGADVGSSRRADTAAGWAYRLLAAHGTNAAIGEHEWQEMRTAGLDDALIAQVQQTIVSLRSGGAYPPMPEKILVLMEELGIDITTGNFQHVQQIYLRGIAAALLDTRRRWSGIRTDDDAFLQQAYLDQATTRNPPNPLPSVVPVIPQLAVPIKEPVLPAVALPVPEAVLANITTAVESPDEVGDDLDLGEDQDDNEDHRSLVTIVTEAADYNLAMKEWGKDTRDQHISLAKLFARFVGHDNPRKMRQGHIAQFRIALVKFPKNYGKSPKDFIRSIPEILERAAELPKEKVGLSSGTMNRHMTQMGNIVKICESAGHPFADFEGVEGLRTKKKGSARGERPRFLADELRMLCSLPIWHGCQSDKERLKPGNVIIHDATYWGPIIAMYTGARREEFCGLLLSEVGLFEDVYCLRLENSAIRDLKNEESKRRVPLHSELSRLGLPEYVDALRAAGHIYLFPELKAAAEGTPMGDVFDDAWQKNACRGVT